MPNSEGSESIEPSRKSLLRVVVRNAGRSASKAARFEVELDGVGANLLGRASRDLAVYESRRAAFRAALETAGALSRGVDAVGHRVVHGGRIFSVPVRVDAEAERSIEAFSRLAPQRNPAALEGIRLACELFPGRPAVGRLRHGLPAAGPEPVRSCSTWHRVIGPRGESGARNAYPLGGVSYPRVGDDGEGEKLNNFN